MAKMNFFVVFEGRAGSGLLRAILNSNPRVVAEAEWMMFDLRKQTEAGPQQNERVSTFFADVRFADMDAVGFVNKLSDILDPEGFAAALNLELARVISLKRRNLIKQVISGLNALRSREQTGKVHAYSRNDIVEQPFAVDLEQVDAHLRRMVQRTAAQDDYATRLRGPGLEIFYEDLAERRTDEIRRLADFLGISPESMTASPDMAPIKQSPTDLRDLLTNYDDLVRHYRETPYEGMVRDVGV
jgi:hypothetical protein